MVYQRDKQQLQIEDFVKKDNRLQVLDSRLNLCGKWATKNFYCKKDPMHEHLLKSTHNQFFCEIRYCNHPGCLIERFKRQMQTFDDITRFSNLNSLWHFVIGFKPISEVDFKYNFSKYKKKFETVLNRYFEKLKKSGINVQAVRVLDFSFKTEGQIYLHYHFGALPIGSKNIRSTLIKMHTIRKDMINKQRIKIPFHFQDFGLKNKKSVLSYLSIRASGMYKYDMTKNPKYKHIQSNLRESIKAEKYIFLRNVLTKEEYLKSFYNKAHFVCIGGLPRPPRHGSNITDGIPSECPLHGALTRKDVRIEVIFDEDVVVCAPPPDFSGKMHENIEVLVIRKL